MMQTVIQGKQMNKFTGKIKNIKCRKKDVVISYTSNVYPNSSGYEVYIEYKDIIGEFQVGDLIQVNTDNTNEVCQVFVNNKLIKDS